MNQVRNELRHYGVLGMKWGHHKKEEDTPVGRRSKPAKIEVKDVQKKNEELLSKNKHAAVVRLQVPSKKELGPDERAARNAKIKKVAIGVGIGLTVATAAVLYAKNKKTVDKTVRETLAKIGNKPVSSLPKVKKNGYSELMGISEAEFKIYNASGFSVKSKNDAVLTNWIASWASHDIHRYDAISKEAYDSLDDNDLTLKVGQMFHRIIPNASETLRDGAYVSFDENDINRYRAFLPAMWKTNGVETEKVYSMSMEALSDIRSPSAKSRVKILRDLIDEDEVVAEQLRYMGKILSGSSHDFALSQYNTVVTELANRDSIVSKKYLDKVKSLGYNALVDDNDAGRLAKTPMMLLDVANTIKVKATSELTRDDRVNAAKSIVPIGVEGIDSISKLSRDAGVNREAYYQYVRNFLSSI